MPARKYDLKIDGDTWGHLVSRPDGAFVDFPVDKGPSVAHATEAIAAGLQLSYVGMQMIIDELTFQAENGVTDSVASLMYLYFGTKELETDGSKKELAGKIAEVFKKCTAGMDADKPNIDVVDGNAGLAADLNGYVRIHIRGATGRVHIRMKKVMQVGSTHLLLGAPVFAQLYVHEATHRYAKTTDLVGEVDGVANGYMSIVNHESVLAKFTELKTTKTSAESRKLITGKIGDKITPEQGLQNADSFAWFFTGMLQASASALRHAAAKDGVLAKLQAAARRFAAVQAEALGLMVEVAKVYAP